MRGSSTTDPPNFRIEGVRPSMGEVDGPRETLGMTLRGLVPATMDAQ